MGNHQLIQSADFGPHGGILHLLACVLVRQHHTNKQTNKTNKRTDRQTDLPPLFSLLFLLYKRTSQGWSDRERKLSASSEKWPGEGGKQTPLIQSWRRRQIDAINTELEKRQIDAINSELEKGQIDAINSELEKGQTDAINSELEKAKKTTTYCQGHT